MFDPETFTFNTEDVTVYLAAAGAGKTTALVRKISELLQTYRPDEIAFVTFTRKGVANGIERTVLANPGLTAGDLPHFKTLHALCFRELGLEHTAILTRKHMDEFNEKCDFHIHMLDAAEKQTDDDRLLARYEAERSGVRGYKLYAEAFVPIRYEQLKNKYDAYKKARGLVDFYDCLLRFKKAGKPVAVKAAFIDEAQDLTALQWEVCKVAFSQCEKIFIAGDDLQTLFSHCGAVPQALIAFSTRYPTVKLEQSFRLPKSVYRFAKGITAIIQEKVDKDFMPAKDVEGFVEVLPMRQELYNKIATDMKGAKAAEVTKDMAGKDYVTPPGRWYLLFRNNHFISSVAEGLEHERIPYHTPKGFFIPKRELSRIKRYYSYRKQGYGTPEAFTRFCDEYRIRDINDEFTESNLIPSERKHTYLRYVKLYGIDKLEAIAEQEPFLLLSTTHRVKGGEADFTAVFMNCTRKVLRNQFENLDEELRVLYVACTRARTGLFLVNSTGDSLGFDQMVSYIDELSA